jgi:hypothetical protein
MAQEVFNITAGLYIIVSAIAFGGIHRRINILHLTNQTQIEFNKEVIKGFTLTREVINK